MRAVIVSSYGGPEVLTPTELPDPEPRKDQVLVRVRATSVNYGDLAARNFPALTLSRFNMPWPLWVMARLYFGWRTPRVRVLGSEFAGEVEAVGPEAKMFDPGDRVFGYLGQPMGAYAEKLLIGEKACIAPLPEDVGFAEAAVAPYGAVMAWHLLRTVGLRAGERLLVNGASGSIGSAAVQLARHHLGAHVTGVAGKRRLAYVQALGAHEVLDYREVDFTRSGRTWDVVMDVLGRSSFAAVQPVLNEGGRYLPVSFKMRAVADMLRTRGSQGKRVVLSLAPGSGEHLRAVAELMAAGKLRGRPARTFPLEDAAEAHRYAESGEREGPVALVV